MCSSDLAPKYISIWTEPFLGIPANTAIEIIPADKNKSSVRHVSLTAYEFPTAGDYYIKVTLDAEDQRELLYVLDMEEFIPVENQTCETAEEIATGEQVYDGNNYVAGNEYGASDSCVEGYYGDAGNDVVYTYTVPVNGYIKATVNAEFDSMLYMVTDCDDTANTCLGGQDLTISGQEMPRVRVCFTPMTLTPP